MYKREIMPTGFCILLHDTRSTTGLQITDKFQASEIKHISNNKGPTVNAVDK